MSWCLIPHHEIALLIDRQLVTRHWLIMNELVAGNVFIII